MKAILVFVVVLGIASIGWGQSYYKYVDENGTVCFTEDPNNVNLRGVVQKDGVKVMKTKKLDILTTEGLRDIELSKIRQAEEERQRRVSASEQEKLDNLRREEQKALARQRQIEQERQRQAQEAAELQRQAEEYRRKTYGIYDDYLGSRVRR
jgi:hypothetical protein